MSDIKNSPLWTIWGEIWNIAKAYYPHPTTPEDWTKIVNDCSDLYDKYANTEYEKFVLQTLSSLMDLYDNSARKDNTNDT